MNEDGKTVAAMDCLVPGIGEIIGGSQREDDYDKLVSTYGRTVDLRKRTMISIWILRKYGSTQTCRIWSWI